MLSAVVSFIRQTSDVTCLKLQKRGRCRAGINISTQIKNSVWNTAWDDQEKNRCFKHPPAARESIRPTGPDSPLEKRLISLQLLCCSAVVDLFFYSTHVKNRCYEHAFFDLQKHLFLFMPALGSTALLTEPADA